MPLSDHEQRILEEIERRLAEEDPKFARGVSTATPHAQSLRKLRRAIAGFVFGFVLLIAGLFTGRLFEFGIVAFVVMLLSAVVIASSVRHIGKARTSVARASQPPKWMGRMEDRWRKRFDKDES